MKTESIPLDADTLAIGDHIPHTVDTEGAGGLVDNWWSYTDDFLAGIGLEVTVVDTWTGVVHGRGGN